MRITLWLAGIMALLLVVACWKYGPGVTPDSVTYLSTAKNLATGNGMVRFDGHPLLNWGPLYPALLAAGYWLKIPELLYALLLNWMAFLLIVIFALRQLRRSVENDFFLTAAMFACLSPVLLKAGCVVYSEMAFMGLQAVFIYLLSNYLQTSNLKQLLMAAGIMGLMCLQRYAGLMVLLGSSITLRLTPGRATNAKHDVIFIFAASLLPGLWLLRNYLQTAAFAGGHQAANKLSIHAFVENFAAIAHALHPALTMACAFSILLWVASFVFLKRTAIGQANKQQAVMMWFYCTIYLVLLLLQKGLNVIELPRYLGVLWLPFAFYIVLVADALLKNPACKKTVLSIGRIVIGIQFFIMVVISCQKFINGAGGMHVKAMMHPPLIAYIQTRLPAAYISNYPDFTWLVNGRTAVFSKYRYENAAQFKMRVPEPQYLFWINRGNRNTILPPHLTCMQLDTLYSAPDSAYVLYRVKH